MVISSKRIIYTYIYMSERTDGGRHGADAWLRDEGWQET